jgi:hypothetical protein
MIVPSRGRPGNIARLQAAWDETAAGDSHLLVACDEDDPELLGYLDACPSVTIGPRERMGPTLNRLAVQEAPGYFAVGFMGDDHCPRTVGWDATMVAVLREMGTGLAYGNDLLQRENLPTAVAMTSDIIQALGYFHPPGLIHLFLDNYWLGLGQQLGRIRYLPDVVIEHVHPLAKTAEWDAGYREVNSTAMYARDHATFLRWVREESPAALAKLRAMIAQAAPA